MARLRTSTATSAGGIVVRFDDGAPSLVVGGRRRERDHLTWTLPKGTPNPGETREQTALREVAEETGLEVRITAEVVDPNAAARPAAGPPPLEPTAGARFGGA